MLSPQPSTPLPVLEIKNLSIDFITEEETVHAVKNISLTIHKNEIVGIAGESGSGKSVTSLGILRLLAPTAKFVSGAVVFSADGQHSIDLVNAPGHILQSIRGKNIAMIFQEPMTSLNPVYTCGEQVAEAIRLHESISDEEAREKTITLFEKVRLPNPAEIFKRYPHQLSGGQKQRIMIAMAISGNPSLLICDEPTTALDVTVQKSVLELIKDLQRETGMSVVFITHDLGVMSEIADRLVIMYKGSIVEEGSKQDVFSSPKHVYTKALLACRPALYSRGTRLPVVADFMSEGTATKRHDEIAVPDQNIDRVLEPVDHFVGKSSFIEVRNLTVAFAARKKIFGAQVPPFKAVDDVSFEILSGETIGLVGESGCGKTTLGRALLRLIEPSSGSIVFDGHEILKMPAREFRPFRKNMQLIFQDPYSSLNPSLTIGSLIGEPLVVHFPGMSLSARREKVMHLLEKVGLPAASYNRYPHEFSGGQRQRIVIARALALNPSFIICDESVSALDVSVQAQVLNLLNELKKEFRFTSIFISHDLSVVRYVSDRIMVMNKGRIVESGEAESVYRNPQSAYTRALIAAVPGVKNVP